ncbi:hypothetical protein BDW22DRAFT_1362348 [Trametopsis cervina]|nr:hypothetical protein BDW22DRAFT_1362348 [Trametopsis cervina]
MESIISEPILELRKSLELPHEIIEYIVSLISEHWDGKKKKKTTLLNCSEISWTWRLACARYLFSHLRITGAERFSRFIAFVQLKRYKGFASCIRSLFVCPNSIADPSLHMKLLVTAEILAMVLDALPNLKNIHLCAVQLGISAHRAIKRTDVLPRPRLYEVDTLTIAYTMRANGDFTSDFPNFLKIFRLFAKIGTLKVQDVISAYDLNAWLDPDSRMDTYPPSIFPPGLRVERISGDFPVKLWHHFLRRTSTIEQQSLVAVRLRVSCDQVKDIGALLGAGGSNIRSLVIDVCFKVDSHSNMSHIVDMDLSGCKSLERVTILHNASQGRSSWVVTNGIVASLPTETLTRLVFGGMSNVAVDDWTAGLADGFQQLQSLLSRFPLLKEVVLHDMYYICRRLLEGSLLSGVQRSWQLLYSLADPEDEDPDFPKILDF